MDVNNSRANSRYNTRYTVKHCKPRLSFTKPALDASMRNLLAALRPFKCYVVTVSTDSCKRC